MARALSAWAINRGGKNSVHNLQYGPRSQSVRGIYLLVCRWIPYHCWPAPPCQGQICQVQHQCCPPLKILWSCKQSLLSNWQSYMHGTSLSKENHNYCSWKKFTSYSRESTEMLPTKKHSKEDLLWLTCLWAKRNVFSLIYNLTFLK